MTETLELELLLLQATQRQNPEKPFSLHALLEHFVRQKGKKTPGPCGIPVLTHIRIVDTVKTPVRTVLIPNAHWKRFQKNEN